MTVCNSSTWIVAIALGVMLAACGNDGNAPKDDLVPVDSLGASTSSGQELINVSGKLFSIPSPIQIALMIRELDLPYYKELTLAPENASNFTLKHRKAMALGMYGADLSYTTVHKDGQRALKTLEVIDRLSRDLNLTNAFDKELMEGFKKNINNEDSLLRFTGVAFRSADKYLKTEQRDDVSTYILAGGWVEGLYLSIGNLSEKAEPKVAKLIGEQKHTLDDLILLLTQQGSDTAFVAALQDLAVAYQGVTMTYQFEQPTLDAANKTTYINSVSKVEVSPAVLKTIIQKLRAVRTSITA